MCFAGDAQKWKGLNHVYSVNIKKGDAKLIDIQEYLAATSIAISYKEGIDRTIIYAYNLDKNTGNMTGLNSAIPNHYKQNGMDVAIDRKDGNTWVIYLTNRTGAPQTFEYNSKMCFEGDAKNWTGLNDVNPVSLENGKTSDPIKITENGTATSIAISYMDGNYRKVFYAYDLDASGTMSAFGNTIDTTAPTEDNCLAAGSMITLADGTQKAVEELTGSEQLLVWNLKTGTFDSAPILFIDSDPIGHYEVIKLSFSDGSTVDVISEHGFWDVDLNEYVYLDSNAAEYIGHYFLRYGETGMTAVELTGVEISTEVTTAYSPVTYGHLCYYVNGMLSMPGGIEGLFNIFEVDGETLSYDEAAMAADIEEYGLFTYEEFYETYPIPEEIFEAFNGEYLKVAVGKGLITYERIGELIERYCEFF